MLLPDGADDPNRLVESIPEASPVVEEAEEIIRVPTVTVVQVVPQSAEVYVQLPEPDGNYAELSTKIVDKMLKIRYGDYEYPHKIPAVSVLRTEYYHPDLILIDVEVE